MASTIRISILATATKAIRSLRETTAAADHTDRRIANLSRRLSALDKRKVKIRLDVRRFASGVAQIIVANLTLDRLKNGLPDLSFGLSKVANKFTLMAAAALAASAAVGPMVTGTLAVGAAFGAAGAGLALFAAVAAPSVKAVVGAATEYAAASHAFDRAAAIGDTKAMTKAQDQMRSSIGALTGAQRQAAVEVIGMRKAWDNLSKTQAPVVLGIISGAAAALAGIIPKLTPALSAVGDALTKISGKGFTGLGKSIEPFVRLIVNQGVPALATLSKIAGNLLPTIGHMVAAFAPLGNAILKLIEPLTVALRRVDFAPFAKSAADLLPVVAELLGFVGKAIGSLLTAAAPLAGPVLQGLSGIAGALKTVLSGPEIATFVANIGKILPAVAPIAGVVFSTFAKFAALLSTQILPMVPKLLPLVARIGDAFISALAGVSPILPALLDLGGSLVDLLPVLQPVLTALQRAAVPVLGALGTALGQSIGPLTDIADGLVSLLPAVASLVTSVTPLIPLVVTGLVPVLTLLSGLLNDPVGMVFVKSILALVAAIWLGNVATNAWAATTKAFIPIKALFVATTNAEGIVTQRALAARIASNIAMVAGKVATAAATAATAIHTAITNLHIGAVIRVTAAQIASTAAMVAGKVAMVAMRGVTLAWVAVQWLLNAALTANPIGLIIVGIAALIALFVLAYKKSDKFREIVDKSLRAIGRAFEWLMGLIGTVVIWLVTKFGNLGRDMMRGLADGIAAGLKWVRDKISGLGKLIPQWLKSVLGIKSPSTVMARVGRDAMRGLTGGIAAQVPALRRTLNGVSDTIAGLSGDANVTVSATTAGRAAFDVAGAAGQVGAVYHVTVNVAPGADPAEAGRQTVKAIEAYERRTGRRRLAPA